MTTYLGKSCSFCLPRVPFVNCRQFMYLVISLLVLRAGYGIWLYQFLIIAYLFTFSVDCDCKSRNKVNERSASCVTLWLATWSEWRAVFLHWKLVVDECSTLFLKQTVHNLTLHISHVLVYTYVPLVIYESRFWSPLLTKLVRKLSWNGFK